MRGKKKKSKKGFKISKRCLKTVLTWSVLEGIKAASLQALFNTLHLVNNVEEGKYDWQEDHSAKTASRKTILRFHCLFEYNWTYAPVCAGTIPWHIISVIRFSHTQKKHKSEMNNCFSCSTALFVLHRVAEPSDTSRLFQVNEYTIKRTRAHVKYSNRK